MIRPPRATPAAIADRTRYRALILVVAVAIAGSALSGSESRASISLTAAIACLLALSLGICFGQGGLMSAAQAAFGTIGAYVTAILSTRWDISPWLGLFVAMLLSAAAAYVIARLVVRLSPFALALATVTFSQILAHLISQGGTFTGGYVGLSGIPAIPGLSERFSQQLFGWGAVAVVTVVHIHIRYSMQGTMLRTIRYDGVLATGLGVAVPVRLASTFALAGGIAGVAGWLYAHKSSYLSAESMPIMLSVTALMMVIIGGTRTITGPIIGAVLVTVFQNYLPGQQLQNFVLGVILLVCLFLFPAGIAGTRWRLGSVGRRWGRRGEDGRCLPGAGSRPPDRGAGPAVIHEAVLVPGAAVDPGLTTEDGR